MTSKTPPLTPRDGTMRDRRIDLVAFNASLLRNQHGPPSSRI